MVECYRQMVQFIEYEKPELALLEVEQMIPTIPPGIGNDIFFTDVAEVLKQTSIARRIEILGDMIAEAQANQENKRTNRMALPDAVRIIVGVIRKFDLEEQWQILRRLPERYRAQIFDEYGFDEARELVAITDRREILLRLYSTGQGADKEKVAQCLPLPLQPFNPKQGYQFDLKTGLPKTDERTNQFDDKAKAVIEELLADEKFWPSLLQNPDLNVFDALLRNISQSNPSNAFAQFVKHLTLAEQHKWNNLFSTSRALYHAGGTPNLGDLLSMRQLLRKGWLQELFGIRWTKELAPGSAGSEKKGVVNHLSVPLENVRVKVGFAEVLNPFAEENKPLIEALKFYAKRADISNPLPVIYSPESPDVQAETRIPLREVLQPVEYTLIQLEPAETLSSISQRHGAILAINDGFFVVQRAELVEGSAAFMTPLGFLLVDGKVFLPPTAKRAALLIGADNKPCVGMVSMENIRIEFPDVGRTFRFKDDATGNGEPFILAPFNRCNFDSKDQNKKEQIIVYTSRFGGKTLEAFVERIEIGVLHNRIIFINRRDDKSNVSSDVPQNGFVLSYPISNEDSLDQEKWLINLKVGQKVKLTLTSYDELDYHPECRKEKRKPVDMSNPSLAVVQGLSCGPLLVAKDIDGGGNSYTADKDFWVPERAEAYKPGSEEFLLGHLYPTNVNQEWIGHPHPRTAIGIQNQQIVMAVHDGDKEKLKFGKSIPDFAGYLRDEAEWDVGLNLDGGGSSEIVCACNVENLPSYEGKERLIATGVMVVPKEKTIQERFLEEVRRWLVEQKEEG
ncbi:phosphodiester glycosidase family protein [Candidatus Poribacteria bacterium]|nr:phosphodiester glycosidase family protein [Candidatus Poribacteria bacterium]